MPIGFADRKFAELLRRARRFGHTVNPRNGARHRILVPDPIRFKETPLIVLRSTAWKLALREWQWFMSGSNKLDQLHEKVRHWWQPWADESGVIWGNYGQQFRRWPNVGGSFPHHVTYQEFDQLEAFVSGIRSKPYSARHVMTTWNPPHMYSPRTPITNCHGTIIQAWVDEHRRLTLFMYQRSCDTVCGLPHNWIQYWAFGLWLASRTATVLDVFIWQGGDVHIYQESHADMVEKIIQASWQETPTSPPQLVYTPTSEEFRAEDFTLSGPYSPLITDKVEMVV